MKMKQLSDEHYIVVNESELEENVLVYNFYHNRIEKFSAGARSGLCWPITHSTQPLEEGTTIHGIEHKRWVHVKCIDLSEVKQLLGIVDVEKKVMELYNNFKLEPCEAIYPLSGATKRFVETIYNQALEDNKGKQFTREDLIKAISETRRGMLFLDKYVDEFIQSLKPKTEWEVEFIDGKLRLKQ